MAGGVPSPGLAAVAVWIDHAIATNAIAATDLSMALSFSRVLVPLTSASPCRPIRFLGSPPVESADRLAADRARR